MDKEQNEKLNISIIIPVYNEEKAIGKVIDDIKKTMDQTKYSYEILVVDDASTDKSKDILEHINKIKIINHEQNKGYGASLKTGIKNAKFEWILIIDADGTYPANSISELLNYTPEYDMVIGARKKYKPFWASQQNGF